MRANKFGEFSGSQDADNLDDADPTADVAHDVLQLLGEFEVAVSNNNLSKAVQAFDKVLLLFEGFVGE